MHRKVLLATCLLSAAIPFLFAKERIPVGGEFRKFPEFLSFFQSDTILRMRDIFTLFCMPSLSSSGLVDPMGSDLLLPNPS